MLANGRTEVGTSDLETTFQVFVLEQTEEETGDGVASALALIVLRRLGGALLAVPQDFYSAEAIANGLTAAAEDQLGQSHSLELPAGQVEALESLHLPVPVPGATVPVTLIDVNLELVNRMTPFTESEFGHYMDVMHAFDVNNPLLFPTVPELVAEAWQWVMDPSSGERGTFYSAAEDEEAVPVTPTAPRQRAKQRATPPGTTDSAARRQKPTVATLAASLINMVLPNLVKQVEGLTAKTAQLEGQRGQDSRASALLQPLGDLTTAGSYAPSPGALLREMPPPRNSQVKPTAKASASAQPARQMAQELEAERELTDVSQASLTLAVLEQSRVLSNLVGQIASGEHVGDMGSSSTGFSSRGAAGRQNSRRSWRCREGPFTKQCSLRWPGECNQPGLRNRPQQRWLFVESQQLPMWRGMEVSAVVET